MRRAGNQVRHEPEHDEELRNVGDAIHPTQAVRAHETARKAGTHGQCEAYTECAAAMRRKLEHVHWQTCATQERSTMRGAASGAAGAAHPSRTARAHPPGTRTCGVQATSCAPRPGAR
eukprot:15467336-Alexandrium_andersonii.AAC.1